MTEKRFHIINDAGNLQKYVILCKPVVVDDETDKKYILALDLLDLLNKLEEENRQLRLELDTHKHPLWSTRESERIVNELKQENEKLKQQRDFYYARLQKIIKIANGDFE